MGFPAGFVAPPVMLVDGTIIDSAILPRNSREGHAVAVSSEEMSEALSSGPESSAGRPPFAAAAALRQPRPRRLLAMRSEGQRSSPSQSLQSSRGASAVHEPQHLVEPDQSGSDSFHDQPVWFHPLVTPQGSAMPLSGERFPGKHACLSRAHSNILPSILRSSRAVSDFSRILT